MKINAYTGTGTLAVLALKRDKVRLTLWVLGIAVITGFLIMAFGEMLPTDKDIIIMTTLHASNPVTRAFLAPASGLSLGGFIMFRLSTVIAVTIALFGMLTVTRHTRHNEDNGCEEMTGSTVVGRHAGLMAALLVTTIANVLLALLIAVAFIMNGQPVAGSFAAGAALGAVGIAFAGIAGITAQLADNSRGANGMAGLVMGATFLLSGTGNMLGDFKAESLKVISAWPVWLSPFGWYQQIHSFHQNNWWILLIFAAFFGLCVTAAFMLNSSRDVGMGIIPAKKGPAAASPALLSPLGLAWRLQRKLMIIWGISAAVFGFVLGAGSVELSDKMSGLEMADQIFEGDIFSMNETFVMALVSILGPFIAFYTVQAFMRMVSEEGNGFTEPVLAAAVTRLRWIMSHIMLFAVGTVFILIILALGGGISSFVETDIRFFKILVSALIQAPAIFILAGFCIMIFGLIPRWSGTLAWAALTISVLAGPFLGPALDLPQWMRNISPFTHVPLPTEEVTAMPIIALSFIAVFLAFIGLVSFRRRNLSIWKQ